MKAARLCLLMGILVVTVANGDLLEKLAASGKKLSGLRALLKSLLKKDADVQKKSFDEGEVFKDSKRADSSSTAFPSESTMSTAILPNPDFTTALLPNTPRLPTDSPPVMNTTVYEGLQWGLGDLMLHLITAPEVFVDQVTMEEADQLRRHLEMLAFKFGDDMQSITALLTETRNRYQVQTINDVINIMHSKEFQMFVDFDFVHGYAVILAMRGVLSGTEEHEDLVGREVGCGQLRGIQMDFVCIVNKLFALFDATQRTVWNLMAQLSEESCFKACGMMHEYLATLDWTTLDPVSAVDAGAETASCIVENLNLITTKYYPSSPKLPTPRYLMPRLLQYIAYIEVLRHQYNQATTSYHALLYTVMDYNMMNDNPGTGPMVEAPRRFVPRTFEKEQNHV